MKLHSTLAKNGQKGSIFDSSVQADIARQKDLLTFTQQPAELFERNTLKLDTVVLTKHFVVVRGTNKKGIRTAQIYNQSGRMIAGVEDQLGPAVDNLLKNQFHTLDVELNAVKKFFEGLDVKGFTFPRSQFRELLGILKSGYSTYVALKGKFRESEVGKKFETTTILKMPEKLFSEPSGRYISYKTSSGDIGVYDTQDTDGRPLPWTEWKITEWGAFEDLDNELDTYPFLSGFSDSLDGVLLPTGKHLATYRDNLLTIVESNSLLRVFSDACNGYACDPKDPDKLIYVNEGARRFNWIDLAQTSASRVSIESTPIPFEGKITDLKFDPVGNFILCSVLSADELSSKLVVLDKRTMQVITEHHDVWGELSIDSVGTIFYIDQNFQLRVINTNLITIPEGGLAAYEEIERVRAVAMLNAAATITLPELPDEMYHADTLPIESIEEQIPTTLLERFNDDILKAESIPAVEKLEAQFDVLRNSDEFRDSPLAFSMVDEALRQRRRTLAAQEIASSIESVLSQVKVEGTAPNSQGLKKIAESLSAVRKARGEIVLADGKEREDIDGKIAECILLLKEAHEKVRGTITVEIESLSDEIIKRIIRAQSVEELHDILISDTYALHSELINSLQEKEERTKYRGKISDAIKERTRALEQEATLRAIKDEELARESAEEATYILEQLKVVASKITSPAELRKLQTSPLITAFNTITKDFSEADQMAAQASVATLLQQAGAKVAVAAGLQKVRASGGYITIGTSRFMIAGEYSPVISRVENNEGSQEPAGQFVFKDGFGRNFTSTKTLAGLATNSNEYEEAAQQAFKEALAHFKSLGRKVPEMRPTWRMTRHTEECLEKIVRELTFQRESGQGILILEGEAGTGKNVLIDILASMACYERFMFACNYQTQKEDFTYEYAFSPDKGTYRVNAKLLEKLQTPYVINAFDEINTLPPGVLKMLNALLDERRTLYLADGRELPMDPTSLLVGFMNPRNYVGTQELSREVISRASIVTINYPPLRRKNSDGVDIFAPDEATMLACCTPSLLYLSQSEFESAWNYQINREGSPLVKVSSDQERQISGLHRVIKIADAVRQQYTAYQTNVGDHQMDFVFCLRTTSNIARRLTPDCNPIEVVKEVVLPKASAPETRRNLEFIIANT